jgi:hypothetical protein
MLIHKKILAVMSDIKAIAKTQKAEGFAFRGVEDVYNALHPLFREHGIFCVPKTLSHSTNGLGKTIVEMEFSFFAEDGSVVVATTRGESIDPKGDKGTTIATSIATRIALTTMFLIPTESDTPWITPHLFQKATKRIADGDFSLYFKLEGQYRLTSEQKQELQSLIKK